MVEKQPQLGLTTSIHGNILLIWDNLGAGKPRVDAGAVTTSRESIHVRGGTVFCPRPLCF